MNTLVMLFWSILPFGILYSAFLIWRWRDKAKGKRLPVKEKLLRAPGHSALQKISDYEDKIVACVAATAYCGGIISTTLSLDRQRGHYFPSPSGCGAVIAGLTFTGFLTCLCIKYIAKSRHWQLGFSGERAVGEELNKLMTRGFAVFHDFPLNEKGNLDHIVVAPSGVYAVETKTRKKSNVEGGQKLIFDGKGVEFPNGYYDTEMLAQAADQAALLGKVLSRGTAIHLNAKPILVFPGWYVERKGVGQVTVLNQKEIRQAIPKNGPPVLTLQQIETIVAYIEEKCRTVEF